jgi:hypothetical protein
MLWYPHPLKVKRRFMLRKMQFMLRCGRFMLRNVGVPVRNVSVPGRNAQVPKPNLQVPKPNIRTPTFILRFKFRDLPLLIDISGRKKRNTQAFKQITWAKGHF